MNYLWNVLLQAKNEGITQNKLRFHMAKNYSAYMEISNLYLNQSEVADDYIVEINPYYRFFDIFKNMFQPDFHEYEQLRKSLTNLIFHQLAQNDVLSGMTKEEYYKKLLYKDFQNGRYGEISKRIITLFERGEREILLSGMLRQYQTGSSLDLFKDMMAALVKNNIVYHSNHNAYEILLYVGQKESNELKEKVNFLLQMFLEIQYKIEVYYEYHFGIIGMEDTMELDEMVLC